ncbi:hypothetical protein L7F22_041081 [Adiantum nelumboides]|nr:hypothetical protein [Adiantum nelumboides]
MTGIKEKVDVEPEEAPPALDKLNLKLRRINGMTRVNTDNIFLGLYKYDGGEHATYYRCEEPLLKELTDEKKLYVFTYGEDVKTELIMTDKYGRSYVNVGQKELAGYIYFGGPLPNYYFTPPRPEPIVRQTESMGYPVFPDTKPVFSEIRPVESLGRIVHLRSGTYSRDAHARESMSHRERDMGTRSSMRAPVESHSRGMDRRGDMSERTRMWADARRMRPSQVAKCMPKKYGGSGDPYAHVSLLKQVLRAEQITDFHTQYEGFGLTLEGTALTWFQPLDPELFPNIDNVLREFAEEFSKRGIKHNTVSQIYAFKQRENEKVKEASLRFKQYIERCLRRELPQDERLSVLFMEGLENETLKKDLHLKACSTFEQVTSEALYLVDNCKAYGEVSEDAKSMASGTSSVKSDTSIKKDLPAAPTMEQMIEEITKRIQQQMKSPVTRSYGPPAGPPQPPPPRYQVRPNVNTVVGADRPQPVLGQQPPLPHDNRAMIRYTQPYEAPQPMSNAPMLTYYEEPNESYITEPEQPMYAEEPYQSWEMNEGMAQSSYVAQPSRDQYLVNERTLMFIANQNYKPRGYPNRERQPMGPPPPNQQPIGPCFNCGSPDHWERSCPHKGQRVKTYGFCSDCGIKHILPECPRNPDNKGKTTLNKVGVLPSASSGSETKPVVQVNVVTKAQAKELEKEKPKEENARVPVPTENKSLSVKTQRKSWKAKRKRMKARRVESQTAIQKELQEVKQQLQHELESKRIEQNNQPRKAPSGGSVLVDKVLEPLDALLQQWEARLNNHQTLEQRWLTYPYPKIETKRLEMCKDLIRAAQALMEPNVVRAPEREVLIQKEIRKQGDKEPKPVMGPELDTILSEHRVVSNTTDEAMTMEVMPIPEVEKPWPQSLWETIRNRKDRSATLQSAPIPKVVLNNEFYPGDIQSLYGNVGTEVSMDSKPPSLKTLPSFIGDHEAKSEIRIVPSQQRATPKMIDSKGFQEMLLTPEYESDKEDTTVPLERKSQRPRSQEQVLLDKAMARGEARRKELADARVAKAAGKTRPMTMDKARKIRLEKAKAIQKERRRIEAEQKAREEAEAAKAAPTQETEVVDLSGTLEYLKRLEREKHTAEQRAAQLAREKIKEALSRKAEEPVLEPTQGSPKRPRQEEEEEIEDIQADPIPPSPINIPPAPPSSPITPFLLASTPQTPPSPLPLETPLSPPAPISPQQQHPSAKIAETLASITEETSQPMETSPQKETSKPLDEVDEEKQTEGEQHQPTKVDVPILMQVVAKETEIQKTRANQAEEEMANLRTALELETKERDSDAKENENLIRDLMDLQSQLTRKEAQNHELIKNEKKMKELIKYEDARYQKLNASYNTVKNTLIALLQNQEPAAETPSTSDSATLNTLAALQAELQIEKLQRQLLVSGFMSQTAQHEAKVKQLEEELAKAKAELAAVGSLASTSHIQQAETHVPIQPPQLPEMSEFQGTEEEEQQRPAPGALDIREEIEQEIEDLPEGPAKEYLLYKKKVMQSAALAFL